MWLSVRGGARAATSGVTSLYSEQPRQACEAFRHNGESITQIATEAALYSIQDLNSVLGVSGTSSLMLEMKKKY